MFSVGAVVAVGPHRFCKRGLRRVIPAGLLAGKDETLSASAVAFESCHAACVSITPADVSENNPIVPQARSSSFHRTLRLKAPVNTWQLMI